LKPIDIIILLLVLYGGYKGYKKGLLIELVGTVGLVAAIFCGFTLLDVTVGILTAFVPSLRVVLPYIAFVLIFLGVVGLVRRLGCQLRKTLRYTLLGSLDTLAGAVIGVLKVTFSISTMIWIVGLLGFTLPTEQTEGTFLYPIAQQLGPKAVRIASAIFPFLTDFIEQIKSIFEKAASH
jgi:membrane protein required for colicin V production